MNDRVERYLKRFRAVAVCIRGHLASFAAGSATPANLALLDTVIGDMETATGDKVGGGNDEKVGAIQALAIDLGNVHRTAVALDPQHSGLAGDFPIAAHSDGSIRATADHYLDLLEVRAGDTPAVQASKTALVALFVAQDLPATFVTDLRHDRDQVNPVTQAQTKKEQDDVQDTALLEVLISRGVALVNLLDSSMHNKFGRDGDVMRAWKSASHLERAPKRHRPQATQSTEANGSGGAGAGGAGDAGSPPVTPG